MRVTFLGPRAAEPLAFGIMSLAAVLREKGHEVGIVYGRKASDFLDSPEVQRSDVLAMSTTTGLHRMYVAWTHELRARFPNKGIFLGGPHPTFFPQVIESAPFDGVCIGEGEESFPEALEAFRSGFAEVPDGFWIRRDGGKGPVVRGKPRGPIQSLSTLPFPAYDLFYGDPHYRALPIRIFTPTRGCPYRCTYCFNRTLNERYRPYGRLVRVMDPERAVSDIERVKGRFGLSLAWFLDANFVADLKWLEAFLPIYKRRVGKPFFCKLRPERATRRAVRLLVDHGCVSVGVGLECGTERLRREVLGRPVSDADILAGCRELKAHGVLVMGFNMLAVPGERFEDGLRTLALNVACGIDHAGATILQPYPGTELGRRAAREGWFEGGIDSIGTSYFAPSPFKMPTEERNRFTNLARLFSFAVEFPEVRKHIRWLCGRSPNRLYDALFRTRQDFMLRRVFYETTAPGRPADFGTPLALEKGLDDLGVR